MKGKSILSLTLALLLALRFAFPAYASENAAAESTAPVAQPSTELLYIDGKPVKFQMYTVRDALGNPVSFVKARDLAYALRNTRARFAVRYNSLSKKVELLPGQPYTPNGSEMRTPFSGERPYTVCTGTTNVNSAPSRASAIRLTDDEQTGYTYYALRELAMELGIDISSSEVCGISISTYVVPHLVNDTAPSPSETTLTVEGRTTHNLHTLQNLLYVCLPQDEVSTSWPTGAKTSRGTDYYSADALHMGRLLHFDNGSARITCDGTAIDLSAPPLYDGSRWYLPMSALYKGLGFTEYRDTEENHLYYTRLPDVNAIPKGYRVPTLMYHAVGDAILGSIELHVSPYQMEKQLKYLNDNGFTTIFFSDLPNIANIQKPVLLTFDDGYKDNYTNLFPLLKKYNCKATIFMIAEYIGTRNSMDYADLQEMCNSGLVEIQSHTMNHPKLNTLDEAATVYQLQRSQLILTRVTGRQPYVLCYPTGANSALTRRVAKDYYLFGLLMNGGRYSTGTDRFKIPRYYIARSTDIGTFAAYIS